MAVAVEGVDMAVVRPGERELALKRYFSAQASGTRRRVRRPSSVARRGIR